MEVKNFYVQKAEQKQAELNAWRQRQDEQRQKEMLAKREAETKLAQQREMLKECRRGGGFDLEKATALKMPENFIYFLFYFHVYFLFISYNLFFFLKIFRRGGGFDLEKATALKMPARSSSSTTISKGEAETCRTFHRKQTENKTKKQCRKQLRALPK